MARAAQGMVRYASAQVEAIDDVLAERVGLSAVVEKSLSIFRTTLVRVSLAQEGAFAFPAYGIGDFRCKTRRKLDLFRFVSLLGAGVLQSDAWAYS